MTSCDQEADTWMLVHDLQDALDNGATSCLMLTVNTDVVVITVGKFHCLLTNHPTADYGLHLVLLLHSYQYHLWCSRSGQINLCMALPVFHCFSGCDTVPLGSLGGGRAQHGRPGNCTQMWPRHFFTYHSWLWNVSILSSWNATVLFCMTRTAP